MVMQDCKNIQNSLKRVITAQKLIWDGSYEWVWGKHRGFSPGGKEGFGQLSIQNLFHSQLQGFTT